MVDKIIRWIVELFKRHGYYIVDKDTYDKLVYIDALEQWQQDQQATPNRSDEPTPAEILNEWINGEAKPYE